MSPDDRRAAIVAATLPLIAEYGANMTTGQIATAYGVAEGTGVPRCRRQARAADSVLDAAFDLAGPEAALRQIPRELPLADRLLGGHRHRG